MKKILSITVYLIALIVISSCRKLIEVDLPNDKIVTKVVFNDDATANSALTTLYARMNNEGMMPFNLALLTGFYGDELKNYSAVTALISTYQNNLNPANELQPNIWRIIYNHIYLSNDIYEGCEQSNSLSPAVKKQIMAEVRFIRGFWYFYLTNLYGNIPLILTTDYTQNLSAPTTNQSKLYEQIISDLTVAEKDLSTDYVGGNSISISQERVRPTKFAAKAMLAKVYLFTKDFSNAEVKSSEVIENANYQLESIQNVFLKTSKEAIWQISVPLNATGIGTTQEGANFTLTRKPSGSVRNSTLSDKLINSFETGDLRKANWVGAYVDKTVTPNFSYFFSSKYKQNVASTSPTEFTTPLRLAEQFLIRAEARAQLNKLSQSIADIDIVRARAGLKLISDITPNINREDLLSSILHENQIEFFSEWGHRWLDLIRIGNLTSVMAKVALEKGGIWHDHKKLWPIPFYDIQNNPHIEQNPGYINQ